jgi:hypothetical protein
MGAVLLKCTNRVQNMAMGAIRLHSHSYLAFGGWDIRPVGGDKSRDNKQCDSDGCVS